MHAKGAKALDLQNRYFIKHSFYHSCRLRSVPFLSAQSVVEFSKVRNLIEISEILQESSIHSSTETELIGNFRKEVELVSRKEKEDKIQLII